MQIQKLKAFVAGLLLLAFNSSVNCLASKNGKVIVEDKDIVACSQARVDCSDCDPTRVVIGRRTVSVAPVAKSIAVEKQTFDVISTAALSFEAPNHPRAFAGIKFPEAILPCADCKTFGDEWSSSSRDGLDDAAVAAIGSSNGQNQKPECDGIAIAGHHFESLRGGAVVRKLW